MKIALIQQHSTMEKQKNLERARLERPKNPLPKVQKSLAMPNGALNPFTRKIPIRKIVWN